MQGAGFAVVHPFSGIRGTLKVPGDKSITHRLALLASLSAGTSAIDGFLNSEDSRVVLGALRQLGVASEIIGDRLIIHGHGAHYAPPASTLDLGNSGTGIRLLAGILAGQSFVSTMSGDASLNSRPMQRVREPLAQMGVEIDLLGSEGRPPVCIHGGGLRGIDYRLPMASAQIKSCVLLAALFAEGVTTVIEPVPTRDHTERLLKAMGAGIVVDGLTIRLAGCGKNGPSFAGRHWKVPGDFSSAAFWITAAAVCPGREIQINDVGLNPRRCALLTVLRRMGARIEVHESTDANACEEMGSITVRGAALSGTEVGGAEIPNLIDELPLVAVAGALARGRTVISGAAELRVKESDRIAAMASNLARMGIKVAETPDGMIIDGGSSIAGGASIDSYGDHRIPMAMSVLTLSAERPVRMDNIACVAKSYPEFWRDARMLGVQIEHNSGN